MECAKHLWDAVGVCLGRTSGVESHHTLLVRGRMSNFLGLLYN